MIADVIGDACHCCGRRPERRDVVELDTSVWWVVVCCRPRLIHIVGPPLETPEREILVTRRDLLRTQGAIAQLGERVDRLERERNAAPSGREW